MTHTAALRVVAGSGRLHSLLLGAQALAAGAAVGLLIFPSRYSEDGLYVIALAWLLGWLATGKPWWGSAVDLPVAGILVIALASWTWVSADRGLSWLALCQIIAGVTTFFAITQMVRARSFVLLATILLLAAGCDLALYGLAGSTWWEAQKFLVLPAVLLRLRPQVPEIVNANILGGALLPLVALASALVLFGRQVGARRRRWLIRAGLALAWLIMTAMLGLTQSRGAWLALAVVGFFLMLIRTRWALALLPVAGGLFWSIGPAGLLQLVSAGQSISSWEGRQEVWSRAVYMIQDFPFTGIGVGTFGRVSPILYPFFIGSNDEGAIPHAHNLLLQVGVDLGVFGLVAFVALFVACLVMVLRWWYLLRARDPHLSALALGLGAALVAILLHGLVDAPLWQSKMTVVLWAVLGLSVAVDRVASGARASETGSLQTSTADASSVQ